MILVNLKGKVMDCNKLEMERYYYLVAPEFKDNSPSTRITAPRVRGNEVANRIRELALINPSRWYSGDDTNHKGIAILEDASFVGEQN